jgi:hypothetical protein
MPYPPSGPNVALAILEIPKALPLARLSQRGDWPIAVASHCVSDARRREARGPYAARARGSRRAGAGAEQDREVEPRKRRCARVSARWRCSGRGRPTAHTYMDSSGPELARRLDHARRAWRDSHEGRRLGADRCAATGLAGEGG